MKLIKSLVCTLALGGLFSCAKTEKKSPTLENPWTADMSVNMRHGWTVFSGPERTVIGVNDQDSINRGRKSFEKHCAQCHGEKGNGDGELAKQKGLKPANLAAISKTMPNHFLVVQINEGRSGGMPAWRDLLDAQEAWDLTNYIQQLTTENKKPNKK